jgi:hypothetical protein
MITTVVLSLRFRRFRRFSFPCEQHRVAAFSPEGPPRLGTECRSRLSRARLIFFRGPARTVWEHSIPALDQLRYSITLRTLVAKAPSGEEGK